MSLLGQKLDALSQLKVTTSLGDGILSDNTLISTLKNGGGLGGFTAKSKDAAEYIIDLMTILFGADFLEKAVNSVMKQVFKRNSNGKMLLEEDLKVKLLDALCGSDGDKVLPLDFYSPGYAVPVRILDLFDVYKLNPNHVVDSKLFGSFESDFLKNVLQNVSSTAGKARISSMPYVYFDFNATSNAVTLSADVDSTQQGKVTIQQFFSAILNDPGFKILDASSIALEVLDLVLGLVSSRRTTRGLANEELLRDIVTNISNEQDTETVFTFNPKSLSDIEAKAKLRKLGGYTLDLGCNVTNVQVGVDSVIDKLDNQADYAGMFTATLESQLAADGTTLTDPIRQNFQSGLMKALLLVILKHTLFSPKIWTLFVLSRIFHVGYPQSKFSEAIASGVNRVLDIQDIVKNRQDIVKSITDSVRKTIIEYLSQYLLKEVLKRVLPVKLRLAQEQLEAYTKILASFLG